MQEGRIEGLSLVLPVFNEGDSIEGTIRTVVEHVKAFTIPVEIIAVDDGSVDSSAKVLRGLSQDIPFMKVVTHPRNIGYGAALRSGIKAAVMPWILLMDADGQFHITSFDALWKGRGSADILLGFRQRRADNWYRFLLGRTGNTLANVFLRRSVKDINCGFKLVKTDLVKSLDLQATGAIINFEMLYLLSKRYPSVKLEQFPIIHYPRVTGKATGGGIVFIWIVVSEALTILLRKDKCRS